MVNNLDGLGMPISIDWIDNGDFISGMPESYYSVVINSAPAIDSDIDTKFVRLQSGTNSAGFSAFGGDYYGHYNSGQAIVGFASAKFDAGVADNTRFVGMYNPCAEYGLELSGTTWQVVHRSGAVQEIRTLTITTAASSATDVTITLNGVAFTVAVTNAGGAGNTQITAREIAVNGSFARWTATAAGSVVTFVADWSGPRSGSYSFNAGTSGAVATGPTSVRAGADYTINNAVALASVSGDKLNGTGLSGHTIAASKSFVFRFMHGYLGAANPLIYIQKRQSNEWVLVHCFDHGGMSDKVNLNPPSMYAGWRNYNSGNTTNVSIYGASYAVGASGSNVTGIGRAPENSTARTLGTGSFLPVFAIRMGQVKNNRINWDELLIDGVQVFGTATTRTQFKLLRNPTAITGATWTASTNGAVEYDETATAYTGGEPVGACATTSSIPSAPMGIARSLRVQRGDVLLVVANGTGGANYSASASIQLRER